MNAVSKNENAALARPQRTVLELEVNNHAGVMSHVVGLFSRRAYNVEGILCLPVGDGSISRAESQAHAGLAQVFDTADADKDGKLTPDEYRTYSASQQK